MRNVIPEDGTSAPKHVGGSNNITIYVKKHARVGEMKGSREIYNDIWRTSCIVRTFVE